LKKMLVFIALLMLILVGCSAEDDLSSGRETETAIKDNDVDSDSDEAIQVDKGIFDVTITLPASMFEPGEIEEAIASAKESGDKEVVVNDDGSLTYKMSKATHRKMMEEIRENFIESFANMKTSGEYVSIRDIKYNRDFTQITLVVDKDAFENSFDAFAVLGVGMLAMYYQLFDGVGSDNIRATVNVEDWDTGETINSVVYPDAFDSDD
jgi:PBP1b-binding outer membrane lipoprotein LpoB